MHLSSLAVWKFGGTVLGGVLPLYTDYLDRVCHCNVRGPVRWCSVCERVLQDFQGSKLTCFRILGSQVFQGRKKHLY